ncbi:MAG: hypothetical protein MUC38_15530 [Cyclobacteriaceae bacterium]|jgi:hypothetical protein|nr:hypothetical protein [Cyclobacteriaceae bacterium]
MNPNRPYVSLLAVAVLIVAASCGSENGTDSPTTQIELKNHSVTPALIKPLSGFENLEIFSLVGSDDVYAESPDFTFGGSADGAGLLKNEDGTFSLVVNHEDNFAVSRVTLDKTFKPVKGEYILNSNGGIWRLCSATLATDEEHGFGPVFLTCGESGQESRTHALDPRATAAQAAQTRELAGFGRWSAENAVPLPKTAYPGKTAVIIGDDDSGTDGGQVALYLTNTPGDLINGALYLLRRADQNTREMDLVEGAAVNIEFVQIPDHRLLTGAQMNTISTQLKGISFGRVEDIDYRKDGVGREIYFNVTGQAGNSARTKYGRVYKLVLNANDPLKGTLELILDGDNRSGKAGEFQNPDNIYVGANFAYIQEDPNAGYNDQTHDSYIYQYNLTSKELKPVLVTDHRRDQADAAKYNVGPFGGYPQPVADRSGYGTWEYGAMIDISKEIGIEDTYAICIQPHTWLSDDFKGVDGGTLRPNERQGSQVVIIKGLPK